MAAYSRLLLRNCFDNQGVEIIIQGYLAMMGVREVTPRLNISVVLTDEEDAKILILKDLARKYETSGIDTWKEIMYKQ